MLPYDQKAHPTSRAKTAPYAVVNHWRRAPGMEGEGGDSFLSGSISTALRNVWHGIVGLRPDVCGLVIDPCLPKKWKEVTALAPYLGKTLSITIFNPKGKECGVKSVTVDGKEFKPTELFEEGERKIVRIPAEVFQAFDKKTLSVEVML